MVKFSMMAAAVSAALVLLCLHHSVVTPVRAYEPMPQPPDHSQDFWKCYISDGKDCPPMDKLDDIRNPEKWGKKLGDAGIDYAIKGCQKQGLSSSASEYCTGLCITRATLGGNWAPGGAHSSCGAPLAGPFAPPAKAKATGDPHFVPFNGQSYGFQGSGTFAYLHFEPKLPGGMYYAFRVHRVTARQFMVPGTNAEFAYTGSVAVEIGGKFTVEVHVARPGVTINGVDHLVWDMGGPSGPSNPRHIFLDARDLGSGDAGTWEEGVETEGDTAIGEGAVCGMIIQEGNVFWILNLIDGQEALTTVTSYGSYLDVEVSLSADSMFRDEGEFRVRGLFGNPQRHSAIAIMRRRSGSELAEENAVAPADDPFRSGQRPGVHVPTSTHDLNADFNAADRARAREVCLAAGVQAFALENCMVDYLYSGLDIFTKSHTHALAGAA